jgi:hypothetical protein
MSIVVSVRDLLAWVSFINSTVKDGGLGLPEAFIQGNYGTHRDIKIPVPSVSDPDPHWIRI